MQNKHTPKVTVWSDFSTQKEIIMQQNIFIGNLTAIPKIQNGVAKFNLISNEYAGRDEKNVVKNRTVSIQFTAFGKTGEAIANHGMTGDQFIVNYRVENNNYDKNGETVYSYNFIVERIEFGAPGKAKREKNNTAGK